MVSVTTPRLITTHPAQTSLLSPKSINPSSPGCSAGTSYSTCPNLRPPSSAPLPGSLSRLLALTSICHLSLTSGCHPGSPLSSSPTHPNPVNFLLSKYFPYISFPPQSRKALPHPSHQHPHQEALKHSSAPSDLTCTQPPEWSITN